MSLHWEIVINAKLIKTFNALLPNFKNTNVKKLQALVSLFEILKQMIWYIFLKILELSLFHTNCCFSGNTPLQLACGFAKLEHVRLLVTKTDLKKKNIRGKDTLYMCGEGCKLMNNKRMHSICNKAYKVIEQYYWNKCFVQKSWCQFSR